MKKIFISHYKHACGKRSLDTNKVCKYLLKNGYIIVDKPDDADIIFFVTCASVNTAAEGSLNRIKELQKYDAELIVAGCLPAVESKRLAEIFDGKTISTKDIDKIDSFFPNNKIPYACIDDANFLFQNVDASLPSEVIKKIFREVKWIGDTYAKIIDHILKNLFGEKSLIYNISFHNINKLNKKPYFILRISWGCKGNCSYCVIKNSTGPFRSKSIEECIKEFEKGLDAGYKKFIITAVDPGAYGLDIGSSFSELLDKITMIPGGYEITVRSVNPRWVVKYIDDLEKIVKRQKISQIGIPIQSGSSRILKLMHRFPDTEKMKDVCLRLKKAFPEISLQTHIITGFPTETEEEFRRTLCFVKECKFSAGFVYRFSCRSGTEAEQLKPKIPERQMFQRLKYAKKFLKNEGYGVVFIPKLPLFIFDTRD